MTFARWRFKYIPKINCIIFFSGFSLYQYRDLWVSIWRGRSCCNWCSKNFSWIKFWKGKLTMCFYLQLMGILKSLSSYTYIYSFNRKFQVDRIIFTLFLDKDVEIYEKQMQLFFPVTEEAGSWIRLLYFEIKK